MFRYISVRIILMPVILVAVTAIIFFLIRLSPADPATSLYSANVSAEEKLQIYEEYGFDDPLIVQYQRWLVGVVQGNFGISYQSKSPVWDEISARIPVSVGLAAISMCVIVALGVPIGVMCAVKQYSIFDVSANVGAKIISAVPVFLLSVIFMYIFSIKLGWLPTVGLSSPKHWILPVLSLVIPNLAGYIRQTRSSMLDCIRQDYVRTARSKGETEQKVIFREALKNAMLPILTMTGGQFARMIGGALVVENVFAIPGIGYKVVQAIQSMDAPVVLGCSAVLALMFLVVTLIVDLLYAVVDPRTKSTFVKAKNLNVAATPVSSKGA